MKSAMKRSPLRGFIAAFTLCFALWGGVRMTGAQAAELLANPGFEPPFVNQGGEPARLVATGWTAWHVSATAGMSLSENVQPEYYPASDTSSGLSVPRVLSGQDAQQYFSFFATHTGGVYQRVTNAPPGTALRFSVNAYIWSSSFDDVDVSEQDGGILLQAGIDPTGGTDGASANIVWSAPVALQYDSYDEYSVTATASGSAMTVFVRSTVSFPVKNNYIFLDDASLRGANAPVPTTVVPATTAAPTRAPATSVPATAVPATSVPATVVPATSVPATNAPATVVPATSVVATNAPATSAVSTNVPTQEQAMTPSATSIPTTPAPTLPPQTPTASPTVDTVTYPATIVYTVQRGDSVSRLAVLFGSDIQTILSANGLPPSGLIFIGQRLIIPVRLVNTTATAIAVPSLAPTRAPTTVVVPTLVPTTAVVPTAMQPTPVGTVSPDGTVVIIVQYGESLSYIAARYQTTTRTLAQLNGILNPNLIYAGQRLRVPAPGQPQPPSVATAILLPTFAAGVTPTQAPPSPILQTYQIRYGDSLYKVALQFNVPLSRLIQFNGILNANRIYPGQIIVIPPN